MYGALPPPLHDAAERRKLELMYYTHTRVSSSYLFKDEHHVNHHQFTMDMPASSPVLTQPEQPLH
jgi:hypothetical protein